MQTTFKPNFIKIDPYNIELYRFKVSAFLRQCSSTQWYIYWMRAAR